MVNFEGKYDEYIESNFNLDDIKNWKEYERHEMEDPFFRISD